MKSNSFNSALVRPKLVVHDFSHTISKQKPRIRIIHIAEPEIIKTDVENFQELVQRLTGKPVERKRNTSAGKKASSVILHPKPYCSKPGKSVDETGSQDAHTVKKEIEEIYLDENENVLSFLGELDGFLHDLDEFPLISSRPSQINAIW